MWRQYRVDLIVALVAISQVADVMFRTCCCLAMAGSREVTSSALPIYDPHPINHVEQRWHVRTSTIMIHIDRTDVESQRKGIRLNMQASADSPTDPWLRKHFLAPTRKRLTLCIGPNVGDEQGRCQLWCTCLRYSTCSLFSSGDDMGDLQTVARIFADIFHSEGQKPFHSPASIYIDACLC
jgi:hypothetical protein